MLRKDDPRLGEFIESWNGARAALKPGRAVLVGFPQDEGIRRNQGRPGAALGPRAICSFLRRLTPWDPETDVDLSESPPLDAGNIRITGSLEDAQAALGRVVGGLLQHRTVPIVTGGGHETAYGHYQGYVAADQTVGVINIDAHPDVRPLLQGRGHSGSPFRQMVEHPGRPLPGRLYACHGLQPGSVARAHWQYLRQHGCSARLRAAATDLVREVGTEVKRLSRGGRGVYVSVDADAFSAADVPAVSAPNPNGLPGSLAFACARSLGQSRHVSSFELVEIAPGLDRDGQSARWAALVIWNFLIGLRLRPRPVA